MIIKFQGSHSKEDILKQVEQIITNIENQYNVTPCDTTLYINFENETGRKFDIIDESGSSQKIEFHSEQERSTPDPMDLGIATNFIKKSEFRPGMFVGEHYKMPKELEDEISVVGFLYRYKEDRFDKVFSIEEYLQKHGYTWYDSLPNTMIPKSNISYLTTAIDDFEIKGLCTYRNKIEYVYDMKEVVESTGKQFLQKSDLVFPLVVKEQVKKVKREYFIGKEIGYMELNGYAAPVYNFHIVLKENGLHCVSCEELEEKRYKQLFKKNDLNPVPVNYDIKNKKYLYGYTSQGEEIYALTESLDSMFPVLSKENISSGDIVVSLPALYKFKTLMKETGSPIEERKPIGINEDYQFVYQGNVPEEIKEKFEFYLKKKKLEEILKK